MPKSGEGVGVGREPEQKGCSEPLSGWRMDGGRWVGLMERIADARRFSLELVFLAFPAIRIDCSTKVGVSSGDERKEKKKKLF